MPFPNPDTQFKPGESGNPAGKPKGRKSLSTMVRDLLENEIDWKQIPLKNTKDFREMYGDNPLAGEVLVRGAMAEAMGKGGTQAREWLRKSGYGDKLSLSGDEDNPIPILGTLNVHTNDSLEEDSGTEEQNQDNPGGDERGKDAGDPDAPDPSGADQEKKN